jgi:hypothetical protein
MHEFQNSDPGHVTGQEGQHHYPVIPRALLRPEPYTCECLLVFGGGRLDQPAHVVYVTEFNAAFFNFAVY